MESGRWFGLTLLAALIALSIYDSTLDRQGGWFYWISALFYVGLGTINEVTRPKRLRRVRALERHLSERRINAA